MTAFFHRTTRKSASLLLAAGGFARKQNILPVVGGATGGSYLMVGNLGTTAIKGFPQNPQDNQGDCVGFLFTVSFLQ